MLTPYSRTLNSDTPTFLETRSSLPKPSSSHMAFNEMTELLRKMETTNEKIMERASRSENDRTLALAIQLQEQIKEMGNKLQTFQDQLYAEFLQGETHRFEEQQEARSNEDSEEEDNEEDEDMEGDSDDEDDEMEEDDDDEEEEEEGGGNRDVRDEESSTPPPPPPPAYN